MSIFKTCSSCSRELPLSEFYKKRNQIDSICRKCKVNQKRERRKKKRDYAKAELEAKSELVADPTEAAVQTDKSLISDKIVVESGDGPIYKEFKYPDGRTLRLTKPEWDEIVRHFIWLDRQALLLQKSGRISKKNWKKIDPRKVHSN